MIVTFIALTFFAVANACTQRPPPPPPPPPNAPPAPPVPPPIVKVVRQQEQVTTLNVCHKECSGQTVSISSTGDIIPSTVLGGGCGEPPTSPNNALGQPGFANEDTGPSQNTPKYVDQNGNPCVANTNCKYVCKFKVYTEVALTVISKPSNCGCAFHISMVNPRPARVVTSNIISAKVANSVTVGKFELVVWDFVANRVVETVPEFALSGDEATRLAIAQQVKAQNTADFTSVTAAFAGMVTRYPKLPASLDKNMRVNENNVPALAFEITQEYTDIKTWDAPLQPNLDDTPNAYQTQCVPFWDAKPFCYNAKKRQTGGANAACDGVVPTVWMKKYLLFPKTSKIAQNQGVTYASRLITSFYNGNTCRVSQGMFSIDSEFNGALKATEEGANLALGTWAWDRIFKDDQNGDQFTTSYVIGVPGKFSSINEVWDKGYSTISWAARTGFKHDVAGSEITNVLAKKICQKFTPAKPAAVNPKYGETALVYRAESGIKCGPFDDVVFDSTCGSKAAPDKSLMAFLNEGEILNFNKKPDSVLVMGKMDKSCNSQPYKEVVFDVLTFHGVQPGREPLPPNEKRAVHDDWESLGLVYDDEAEGFVHFLHARGHNAISKPHKRALADALRNQVATPPNEANYDMRVGAGSTDSFGADSANAGDHPLSLFPETFTAPVNIDPQADAPSIVEAQVTTGSDIPICNRGSVGCSCRLSGAACDIGLTCDSNAKCMTQGCTPGAPGCPCRNGACESGNECKTNICVTKSTCEVGKAGCECAEQSKCTDGISSCRDGFCITDGTCTSGTAGCACAIEGDACSSGFACNPLINTCLAPRCKDGTPGCRCHSDSTCAKGFQCSNKICALKECPVGEPGCSCTNKDACLAVGFKCVAYLQTGDKRCVAEPTTTCGDQTKRCVRECGVNNVKICPRCDNGIVLCTNQPNKDPCAQDPFGPACKSGAVSTVVALVSVLVAIVAMF